MGSKDEVLQIRCEEEVAEQFRVLAVGHDTQGDALRALLEAHGEEQNNLGAVSLDPLSDRGTLR